MEEYIRETYYSKRRHLVLVNLATEMLTAPSIKNHVRVSSALPGGVDTWMEGRGRVVFPYVAFSPNQPLPV